MMPSIVPNIEKFVEVIEADRDQLRRGLLSTGGWSVAMATVNVAGLPDSDGALQMLARHRLAYHPRKSGEDAGELVGLTSRVAEVVNEDGGCWTACSGCQESDEGYVSEKYYPYSPVFQCQPGGGCNECGGIGVLWQDGAFLASYGNALSADTPQTREVEAMGVWIGRAQASFDADPPDSDHQRGYLSAVQDMRATYEDVLNARGADVQP